MTDNSPKRHLFQLRRKEARAGARDPFYSPERDLAHIGPAICRAAMHSMEPQHWEPWLKEVLDAHDVTYEKLLETKAPLLFAQAMNKVIGLEHPPAAMADVGFDKLPGAIQMLFYARLGQCLLAAVWTGVKDVGRPDSDPPADIQSLLDDIQAVFDEFFSADAKPCDDKAGAEPSSGSTEAAGTGNPNSG